MFPRDVSVLEHDEGLVAVTEAPQVFVCDRLEAVVGEWLIGARVNRSVKDKDFEKPKVMWKIIGCNINFCFDEKQFICNNAVNIMIGRRERLIQFVGLMNSRLFDWYLKLTTEAEVQGGGIQLYVTTLEKTLLRLDFPQNLTDIICQRINGIVSDEVVDKAIFDAYGLSIDEQSFILQKVSRNREA